MQKITTFLWFDKQAQEAAKFYVSVFEQAPRVAADSAAASKIKTATPMIAVFELEGQEFMALNGGPQYKFTPAVSLFVKCETQEEVDYFWQKLSEGGRTDQCGWLQDKFGLSWQIVPTALMKLMGDPDPAKSKRVMDAMLKMTKIEIADLQKAYDGG